MLVVFKMDGTVEEIRWLVMQVTVLKSLSRNVYLIALGQLFIFIEFLGALNWQQRQKTD